MIKNYWKSNLIAGNVQTIYLKVEIDNPASLMNRICNAAKKEDIISINSKKDRHEFVADLLSSNKINEFKNRTIKKVLREIKGGK